MIKLPLAICQIHQTGNKPKKKEGTWGKVEQLMPTVGYNEDWHLLALSFHTKWLMQTNASSLL